MRGPGGSATERCRPFLRWRSPVPVPINAVNRLAVIDSDNALDRSGCRPDHEAMARGDHQSSCVVSMLRVSDHPCPDEALRLMVVSVEIGISGDLSDICPQSESETLEGWLAHRHPSAAMSLAMVAEGGR